MYYFWVPTGERTLSGAMLIYVTLGGNARGGRILSAGSLAKNELDRCASGAGEDEAGVIGALRRGAAVGIDFPSRRTVTAKVATRSAGSSVS